MGRFGIGEIILVLAILTLIFGARRLPQIGEGIGKAIRNLKRGLATDDDIEVTPEDKRVASSSAAEPMGDAQGTAESGVPREVEAKR